MTTMSMPGFTADASANRMTRHDWSRLAWSKGEERVVPQVRFSCLLREINEYFSCLDAGYNSITCGLAYRIGVTLCHFD